MNEIELMLSDMMKTKQLYYVHMSNEGNILLSHYYDADRSNIKIYYNKLEADRCLVTDPNAIRFNRFEYLETMVEKIQNYGSFVCNVSNLYLEHPYEIIFSFDKERSFTLNINYKNCVFDNILNPCLGITTTNCITYDEW